MVKETLPGGGGENEISTNYTAALTIISSSSQVQDISKLLLANQKTFFLYVGQLAPCNSMAVFTKFLQWTPSLSYSVTPMFL